MELKEMTLEEVEKRLAECDSIRKTSENAEEIEALAKEVEEKVVVNEPVKEVEESKTINNNTTLIRLLDLDRLSIKQSRLKNEEIEELLRELSSLITKTEHLVSVLLKISKLDAGTVQFEKKTTDLSSILEKSAEPLLIPMDIKNQKLNINVENIYFDCDSAWCIEAFGNILKNCAEHTPENGEITVTAEDTPIFTEIIITDTGSGIGEEDLPHIFDRFYKGKNSSKESFGVGLNLAKMIILGHNGTIKAENGQFCGAKFTIRFYKQVV